MEQAIAMRIVEGMTCMSQIDDLLAEVAAYSWRSVPEPVYPIG